MSNIFDNIDNEIVRILHSNGRITMQELGKQVHLSGQAVKNRIERLEQLGIIKHYTVDINCPVFGYKIHALIKLELKRNNGTALEEFLRVSSYRIIHCYRITGRQSYMLDVYFASEEERDALLQELERYGVYTIDLVLGMPVM